MDKRSPNINKDTPNVTSIEMVMSMDSHTGGQSQMGVSNDKTVDPPIFTVGQRIPIVAAVFFGLQQVMVCVSGLFVEPLVVSDNLCGGDDPLVRVYLVSAIMVGSGIATVMQCLLGVRLPMLQGPSFAFIPALQVFKSTYPCPQYSSNGTLTSGISLLRPTNASDSYNNGQEWIARMTVVQGSLVIGSCVQIILGASGAVGVIARHCSPLTIAPMMILLELSVVDLCLGYVSQSYMGVVMVCTLAALALYLHEAPVPVCAVENTGRMRCRPRCTTVKLFKMFPYLIAIALVWAASWIMTEAGAFAAGNPARTDIKSDVLVRAPWIQVPYPGQYGSMGVDAGLVLGVCAATLASIVESVGDYAAAARACNEPKPPGHAVSRGILMEGFGCLINALIGAGMSLTTYSENVGVLGITRVCSRMVLVTAGIFLVILGVLTKFGALLAAMPDPLVGGLLTVSLAVVGGVGISSLQAADMRLARNQAIVGVAIITGMMVPSYVKAQPLRKVTESSSIGIGDTALLALNSLLQIHMFIGAAVAFVLDNTVPGATREQRGLSPAAAAGVQRDQCDMSVYDLPAPIQRLADRWHACAKHVPFMPNAMRRGAAARVAGARDRHFTVSQY